VQQYSNAFAIQTIATYSATWALPGERPSDSTTVHGAAAAALPNRHHLIFRLGAGHIQFVYRSHLPLAAEEIILHKILFPPFSRAFHKYIILHTLRNITIKPIEFPANLLNYFFYEVIRATSIKQTNACKRSRTTLQSYISTYIQQYIPNLHFILSCKP